MGLGLSHIWNGKIKYVWNHQADTGGVKDLALPFLIAETRMKFTGFPSWHDIHFESFATLDTLQKKSLLAG